MNAFNEFPPIAMDDVQSAFDLCRTWRFDVDKSVKKYFTGSTEHVNEMVACGPNLSQF